MKRVLIFILTVVLLTGCESSVSAFIGAPTPTPTCESGLPAFAKTLEPLAREWDDVNAVANSTPRNQLSVQITRLQDVRRKVQDISTPLCGTFMKSSLIDAMDATIDGYIAFMAQKPDSDVNAKFEKAKNAMKMYQDTAYALANPTAIPATATP